MNARLTQSDWLDHGLAELAKSGPVSLKADTLAKQLKVSRGSFYWHFQDIGQFHNELLARWRQLATDDIIAFVEEEQSGAQRLRRLMCTAMTSDEKLERGIRSWAAHNAAASRAVASIDKARIKYLEDVLGLAGLKKKQANARAKFIYWAYIGRVMLGNGRQSINVGEISAIADALLVDGQGE